MKHLIIISAVLLYINSYSQNYQESYKTDICSCIETNRKKDIFLTAGKIFNTCFTKHMVKYADFIDAEIKEEDRTKKYIVGQKIRRELQEKFKYELVYSCNAYIDIIETKRQSVVQQYRSKKIDSNQIDKLNETVAMLPLWANYYNRGQYFYYIGDLQKALQDVKKSIEDNPLFDNYLATAQQHILLATIYEEQKKYDKAIAIYDAINSKISNPDIAILKAIVARKRNGYRLASEVQHTTSILNSKSREPNDKTLISKRTRAIQTNKTDKKHQQNSSAEKCKDSAKSLRSLFKMKE
jgi:tetratricopeptide (TPR) repeat protein